MNTMFVCHHCNRPLTFIVIPDGASEEYLLDIPCPNCGSISFVIINYSDEEAEVFLSEECA